MSAGKHSAGPWRVYPVGTEMPGYQVCSRVVADKLNGRSLGDGVSDEDAALIAAAPDLLAACKSARDVIAMERQCFADCNNVPELTAGDDPAGYVQIAGALFALEDAEIVACYDRDLAQLDAAITQATGGAS